MAVESDTSKKTKGGGGGGLTVAAVESAVSVKTYAEVTAALDKAGIPYLKKDMSIPYDNPSQASCFTEWGLSDCPQLLTAPFQLSCSDEHTPGFKAVPLGAHTVAFKQNGWPERHKDAEIGGKRSKSKGKDLLVVELSEARSAAVAAGTLQFAAATGAAVVRLISEGGEDYWALRQPALAKHLCTGKKTVKCALKDVKGYLEERAEEGKQVIFVTNVRLSQLKAADLDGPALRKSAPSVITVVVTPLGPEASEDVRGELAWFIGGGVAELMSGTGPLSDHPPPPKVSLDSLIGEMTSSSVVFGAMTVADFHRRRTGEGQVAHSSLAHCATWRRPGHASALRVVRQGKRARPAESSGWGGLAPLAGSALRELHDERWGVHYVHACVAGQDDCGSQSVWPHGEGCAEGPLSYFQGNRDRPRRLRE